MKLYSDAPQAPIEMHDFTADWFSMHIPLFERFLSDMKDKPCRLLEIGSFEGRSAIWLASNVANYHSSTVETIDAYEDTRLQGNLATTHGKAIFRHGPSSLVLRKLAPDNYDFAYIDGCHHPVDVFTDAVLTWRLVKPGGIIAFDDYLWIHRGETPKRAIDLFLALYSDALDVLHHDYQVWIRKKLNAPSPTFLQTGATMLVFAWSPLLAWFRHAHPWLRPRTRWNALRQRFRTRAGQI